MVNKPDSDYVFMYVFMFFVYVCCAAGLPHA